MKNAPDRKAAESAVEQRNFTTTAPRSNDLQRAVDDIREAVATIARLGDRHAACKEVQQ